MIVIVDDADCAVTATLVGELQRKCDIPIDFLRNRRTKGASGAWNTGIDHILRHFRSPTNTFIGILDDDDSWDAEYLEQATEALHAGSEVVATPFRRIDDNGGISLRFPPRQLRVDDFLIGNPGIQASNLIIRLDRLLQAGCFDEALQSCTDRDLCIRLARLALDSYAPLPRVMVNHFASTNRDRLSNPNSPQRISGLSEFFAKYEPWMTEKQREKSLSRAHELFGYVHTGKVDGTETRLPARQISKESSGAPIHLIVGIIVDVERVALVNGLLEDLQDLHGEPGITGMDVLLLENGFLSNRAATLTEQADAFRQQGLSIYVIDTEMLAEAYASDEISPACTPFGMRLSISDARTALQTYLYHMARRRPGSIVWILDDDMRLPALIDDGNAVSRRRIPLVSHLQEMKKRGLDVAIGRYTGAPPLPAISTLRVQLVDLLWNLRWLLGLPPDATLPSSYNRYRQLRRGRRDFYYDLSGIETDRLESPFPLQPAFEGETVGDALLRLTKDAPRIIAGEQLLRPLVLPLEEIENFIIDESLHRGGNTFIFDIDALADVPNIAPVIHGRSTRRSDMIWALLQRSYYGRRVASVPFATYHDRSGIVISEKNSIASLIDDIRGHAIFAALANLKSDACEDVSGVLKAHADERLASLRMSFFRIEGLLCELEYIIFSEKDHRVNFSPLAKLISDIRAHTSSAVFGEISEQVGHLYGTEISTFFQKLTDFQTAHRQRLMKSNQIRQHIDGERTKNARIIVSKFSGPRAELRVLGLGSEGVVLTDNVKVFKFFDYWKGADFGNGASRLESLIGLWPNAQSLYPITDVIRPECGLILSYPYEESDPYSGGHGPAIVDLLVECHRYGIVCKNIHPKNLRVVGSKVKLIDYGNDIHRVDNLNARDDLFLAMCRRAFLSWRWFHREDLADLMRQTLTNTNIPELEGFDYFLTAVHEAIGVSRPVDPIASRSQALRPRRVLDYGCGKGELAVQLAKLGSRVVAYDPDPMLRERLDALSIYGITYVDTSDQALSLGPYDLVICRRLGCILGNDEFEKVLGDLRSATAPNGRVLLGICHPVYTPKCTTPEASPMPHAGDQETNFYWQKRIRSTGRVRNEVHRPERLVIRMAMRAGFRVVSRDERITIDLERFEPVADILSIELTPQEKPDTTLLVKACAMESETIAIQVQRLIRMLEHPSGFSEILLVLDSRTDGFLRQHTPGDSARLRANAELLREQGWIDRVIEAPGPGDTAASLNRAWMGIDWDSTHTAEGAQLSAIFAAFDACHSDLVLHVDADIMIGRLDREHDYLGDMRRVLKSDPSALTVAFNIASAASSPYSSHSGKGPWRTEARAGLLHLRRLRRILPLPGLPSQGTSPLAWHRALDQVIARGEGTSWRGGDHRTFFVHPTNDRKPDRQSWFNAMDRVESGCVPAVQFDKVDLTGSASDWGLANRTEPFVIVIAGRNVAPGRFRRCLESVVRQKRTDWGAIVIDDASTPTLSDELANICKRHGNRITLIRRKERLGLLANMVDAIHSRCTNSDTVIVTLDADDCLIGDDVLCELYQHYSAGADVTVGSMLRTDKHPSYPVQFQMPRLHRGGNVWQHLRSFRKYLFDLIPDHYLRIDDAYIELCTDWAFMLPIIELAHNPQHISRAVYLHEPGGPRTADAKARREKIIAHLVALPPIQRSTRN